MRSRDALSGVLDTGKETVSVASKLDDGAVIKLPSKCYKVRCSGVFEMAGFIYAGEVRIFSPNVASAVGAKTQLRNAIEDETDWRFQLTANDLGVLRDLPRTGIPGCNETTHMRLRHFAQSLRICKFRADSCVSWMVAELGKDVALELSSARLVSAISFLLFVSANEETLPPRKPAIGAKYTSRAHLFAIELRLFTLTDRQASVLQKEWGALAKRSARVRKRAPLRR